MKSRFTTGPLDLIPDLCCTHSADVHVSADLKGQVVTSLFIVELIEELRKGFSVAILNPGMCVASYLTIDNVDDMIREIEPPAPTTEELDYPYREEDV